MAIAAFDTGAVHPALQEGIVIVNLAIYLTIGMVQRLAQ